MRLLQKLREKASAFLESEKDFSGLTLCGSWHWGIAGRYDPAKLITALPLIIADGERGVLHLEGLERDAPLRDFIEQRKLPDAPRISPGTIWPKASQFGVKLDDEVVERLSNFLEREAAPALCCHLHLTANNVLLMTGYDFGDKYLALSSKIPEEKVRQFCAAIGCTYKRAEQ